MLPLFEPGRIFAERYRIGDLLGRGGFGAVYAAEQLDIEAEVALKIWSADVLDSEAALEQFKLEAKIANRVSSEHVVRVFDVGWDQASRMPFLSMERLRGEHLEQLLQREGPLRPERIAELFDQLAMALENAHGYVDRDGRPRPIVHRDLKPENL